MFPSVFIDDIICKSVFLNWILAYDEQWVRRALLTNSRVWTKKVLQRFCDEGKNSVLSQTATIVYVLSVALIHSNVF